MLELRSLSAHPHPPRLVRAEAVQPGQPIRRSGCANHARHDHGTDILDVTISKTLLIDCVLRFGVATATRERRHDHSEDN